jgi:hypothetical protein
MRKVLVALLSICLLACFVGSVSARDAVKNGLRINRDVGEFTGMDPGLVDMYTSAAVDTYCIVWFTFETMSWQGFTQVDQTAQVDTFFHADDFSDISPGDFGRLVAIEGTMSAWCGTRPGTDMYLCGWGDAPGYGNLWNQMLETDAFNFVGTFYLSYHGVFDSEATYDFTYVEYDLGDNQWVRLPGVAWDGIVDTIVTHEIRLPKAETKLRFHFVADGAWSDEDGRGNSDGACIIDSITIWDSSTPDPLIDFEDFEDWAVGAKTHNGSLWHGTVEEDYGIFSGLYSGLIDKDPCGDNWGTQVVFFVGSEYPSASYPGLYDTPFCKGPGAILGPCQTEIIVSPAIDMKKYTTVPNNVQNADIPPEDLPQLGGAILRFTVYRDLPSINNVFYVWHVRNLDPVTLCPGIWQDRNYVYYGPDMDYIFGGFDISDLVGEDPIQVALGCWDYCEAFYAEPGDCLYHTPSPWIDNARVYRYKTSGPQWSARGLELFQDNFPMNELDPDSWVRADAADDKAPANEAYFIPGDSIAITCASPLGGGIRAGGITGGGEVYMYVRATDINEVKPGLYGLSLEGTYGTYDSDDGVWTKIQCDTAKANYNNVLDGLWMADLNDSLFTRGYVVEYYFEAYDNLNNRSTFPRYADEGQYFEFTCLPTGRSDILFVDDFHGRGSWDGVVQDYWDATFKAIVDPAKQPDVYDVNSPSSMVGNGLASRARLNQLMYNEIESSGYNIIIWDAGDLDVSTIGDGSGNGDKANDCALLSNWLDQSGNDVGLIIAGDDIAFDLKENLNSTDALMLMSTWCGVDYVEDSYFEATGGRVAGGIISPLITGASTGIFYHDGTPDELVAFGGCPIINGFDVLASTNYGVDALMYPDYDGEQYVAGIQSEQENSGLATARTVWLGFSWQEVRDDPPNSPPEPPIDRNELFHNMYLWMQGIPWGMTDTDPLTPKAAMNRLDQNCPNPFNPATTIKFEIAKKGHVSLKIYNVAGQLVKTLINDVMDAGPHSKDWTGTNNVGVKVASGVYFYSIEADGFKSTRKMVLLR